MIQLFRELLSDLEHVSEVNPNEYVSETEIYDFILEKINYKRIDETVNYYFTKLAAAAIAEQIERQDNYGIPSFTADQIFDLLIDRDDKKHLRLYNYFIGKQSFLEHHCINGKTYFLGEDLKIEYDALVRIFATMISSDLETALEKVKRILANKVTIIEWTDLLIGGNGNYEDYEVERMESIINGVIR